MLPRFENLVTQYYIPIKEYICSRVHNIEVSEDIAQDVLFRLYLCLDKLDVMENVKPWIYKVARNRTIDYHRSQQFTNDISPGLFLYTDAIEIDDTAETVVNRIDVQEALSKLPKMWQDILVLHYIHGYTYDELSQLLNKNT